MRKQKAVYIAYTGGTIGMVKSAAGFKPLAGYLTKALQELSQRYAQELPLLHIKEYQPLLDSANMSPLEWHQIASDIEVHYKEFDGFVILHGTDTMAYSASALSFMLEQLSKPVIFTGAQIPFGEIRSDAVGNILGALLIAADYPIPEVGIYFHQRLFRGNRCQKIDATGFHAFSSPNYPPLAEVGTDIRLRHELIQAFPHNPLHVQTLQPPRVVTLHLSPGFDALLIQSLIDNRCDGIILRTYGTGNAPVRDTALMQALKQAHDAGIVIVNCTQCYRGSVDMRGYATGSALIDVGVISGFDMTAEAALTKLYYLFSAGLGQAEIESQMQTNLRGELTRPE